MNTHFYTADPGEYQAAIANQGATDEGNCGYVFTSSPSQTIPLFRTANAKTGGHFYTTWIDERDDAVNEDGYTGEGIACYCYPATSSQGAPLYRASNSTSGDHLYTLSSAEIQSAGPAYSPEGIACNVLPAATASAVPLYRLRSAAGLHFYTIDTQERQNALTSGFVDEGNVGYVFPNAAPGPGPLFRSFNPKTGSHLYTMSITEHDNATTSLGMRADGITCYLYPVGQQPADTQPLYRAYNSSTDDHFYTIDLAEHQNAVQKLGYTDEGTTGWVIETAVSGAVLLRRLDGNFSGDFLLQPPASPKGLTSNSNYILSSIVGASCNPVLGLSIAIDVTSAIVLGSNSGSQHGFSFQLNAFSANGFTCQFQQYVISLVNSTLWGVVNNYGGPSSILQWNSLVNLGGSTSTIPVGYKLAISLQNDTAGNVVGVSFSVVNNNGKTVGSSTQALKDISGINALGTAPIGGFQLNLVGPDGGEKAVLNPGGSGTITYSATSVLTAFNQSPPCASNNLAFFTVETANSVYGKLPASPSKSLVQSFDTNGTTFSVGLTGLLRQPLVFKT